MDSGTIKKEFPKIKSICEPYVGKGGALILVLERIQKEYGYIPRNSIEYISQTLKLSSSHVFGTMSFYKEFTFTPKKKYVIKICRGTACELNGAPQLFNKLLDYFKLNEEGELESDIFSLEQSTCLGECDKSPMLMINDKVYPNATKDVLGALIENIIAQEKNSDNSE